MSLAVELRGLTKVFETVVANDQVSLSVQKGTIHGIIGENGAGKSTAMKMLYGLYAPDSGEIFIHGKKRSWSSPSDAIAAGVGMVHQHFMLAGPCTAFENVILGAEPSDGFGKGLPRIFRPIRKARALEKLQVLARQYDLDVPWDSRIEELSVGIQQRIEILKLLYRNADILILDEPTAVLTPQETQVLFENLKKLKEQGKTILIITHKLKEVMSITDRVTVFRAGQVTGEVQTSQSNPQELANLMVGKKVDLAIEVPPQPELREKVLELEGLNAGKLKDVSFSIRSGEVVGIAGVEGNGQSELLQAILHPAEPAVRTGGRVQVLGHDVSLWPTARIKALGVGFVPEDRHRQGLLLEQSVSENFLLGLHWDSRFQRGGWIQSSELERRTLQAIEEYDVRPRSTNVAAGKLSGGNQQKLIIAREMVRDPKLVIAAQPTRGVDVGAIEFIHRKILQARTQGAGVLLVSSELDEILALSDRILVIYNGKFVAEYARGQCNERDLGMKMGGVA